MPTPALPLPSSTRSKIFRAVVKRLQADPTLSNVVNTWRVWEGNQDDPAAPAFGELTWVRVTPQQAQAQPAAVGLTKSDLPIKIEVVIPGTNFDDILNLWAAIEAALFPGDSTMQQALFTAGGLGSMNMDQPAFGSQDLDGEQVLSGTGIVRPQLLVNTGL